MYESAQSGLFLQLSNRSEFAVGPHLTEVIGNIASIGDGALMTLMQLWVCEIHDWTSDERLDSSRTGISSFCQRMLF